VDPNTPVEPNSEIRMIGATGCTITIHLPADAQSCGLAMMALAKIGFDLQRTDTGELEAHIGAHDDG
jgi:hypothetical protein